MKIAEVSIDKIKPYENNPRINDKAVVAVSESIKKYGFKQPIVVDSDMIVIVGHTRLKAAQMLGIKKLPVIVANDLSKEKAAEYRLADNKTNELSEWDMQKLVDEMNEMQDNGSLLAEIPGFDEEDIDKILRSEELPDDLFDEDQPEDKDDQEYLKFGNKKVPMVEGDLDILEEKLDDWKKNKGSEQESYVQFLLRANE